MGILDVDRVSKSFLIPSVRRSTIREHALDLFRPRPVERLKVLEGISFSIRRGETVGIMGRNGCGKSTLLKILSGIYHPDSGSVRVGAPVTSILELGVGWNGELDAIDNILLIGAVMGRSIADMRRATDQILAFAELERFARLKLKHYSSGMASRLAYAIAFMAVREILILDEVFAVGDVGFQSRCEERFHELKRSGHTIVMVSHNDEVIKDFCDRAILIEQGEIAADGNPVAVADRYTSLLTGDNVGHELTAAL